MSILSEACPICLNSQTVQKKYKEYILLSCSNCEFHFLPKENRESVSQKDIFLPQAPFEFWSTPDHYAKAQEVFQYYFEKRYQVLKRFIQNPLRVLDIGCGHAFWALFLKSKGEDCEGLEPSLSLVDKELVIYQEEFESFKALKTYNCLCLIDVLEHVLSPLEFLNKAHQTLEPNGYIFLQVPSVFGIKIPWGHDPGLPFHYWHFEFKSLSLLLEKTGFEVVYSGTGVLGVVGRHLKQGKLYWWQKILWRFSAFLRRGNRLQVLARRKELTA